MAKNDKLINSLTKIAMRNRAMHVEEASSQDTPQIYAAIAIALHRLLDTDNKTEAINIIFAESQKVWFDCVDNGIDMIQKCIEETGIDIRGEKNE